MLFEGDMIMPVEEVERAIHGQDLDSSAGRTRGARRNRLWPNGVVPFVISESVSKLKKTNIVVNRSLVSK